MDKNQSLRLASLIFGLIALIHLVRAILNLEAVIAGIKIPVYVSYIFVIIASCLSWYMYNVSKK